LGNLIPGEKLIYERVGKVIYARYFNKPEIPRWPIGGQDIEEYSVKDLSNIVELSKTNSTLKKELDKLMNLYYIVKDHK